MDCIKCGRLVESRKPLGRGHSVEKVCEHCAIEVLFDLGIQVKKEPDGTNRLVAVQLQLELT